MNIKDMKKELISRKKEIFNAQVKVSGRIFTLGGLGESALKVKLNSPKGFPHMDTNAFINWKHEKEFTESEIALIKAFYEKLPSK